jgi:hypothetical protein
LKLVIVSIRHAWIHVVKFACERHSKWNDFCRIFFWCSLALNTSFIFFSVTIQIIIWWRLPWAFDVICLHDSCITSKFTFGIWENVYELLQSFCSNCYLGSSFKRSSSRKYRSYNNFLASFDVSIFKILFLPSILAILNWIQCFLWCIFFCLLLFTNSIKNWVSIGSFISYSNIVFCEILSSLYELIVIIIIVCRLKQSHILFYYFLATTLIVNIIFFILIIAT